MPTRTKVSFLFDVKQAANIDDQTLFYMCQNGIKQLQPVVDLQQFTNVGDILHEKSLSFYRGTQTKEELEPVEQRVELLIRMIAPLMIEENA